MVAPLGVLPAQEDDAATITPMQTKFLHAGTLLPGVAVSAVIMKGGSAAAGVLGTGLLAMQGISGASPISGIPLAIVLGVCANASMFNGALPDSIKPGIAFCKDPLLKMGIVVVGIKLSVVDVMSTGAIGIPAVVASIGAGMVFIPMLGKQLRLEPKMVSLIAAGTSICGVTAITALAPAINATKQQTAFAVANVVAFGTMGMLTYPYIAHYLFEHSEQIGMFLGLGVHDTSQVLGSALTYNQVYHDETVLQTATITKLTRNMFLAAAIPYLTYAHSKADGGGVSPMSLLKKSSFVLGFLGMSCVRSFGDVSLESSGAAFYLIDPATWSAAVKFLGNEVSGHYMLGTAMAAVGTWGDAIQRARSRVRPSY